MFSFGLAQLVLACGSFNAFNIHFFRGWLFLHFYNHSSCIIWNFIRPQNPVRRIFFRRPINVLCNNTSVFNSLKWCVLWFLVGFKLKMLLNQNINVSHENRMLWKWMMNKCGRKEISNVFQHFFPLKKKKKIKRKKPSDQYKMTTLLDHVISLSHTCVHFFKREKNKFIRSVLTWIIQYYFVFLDFHLSSSLLKVTTNGKYM